MAIISLDTFTDSNGTALISHTPDLGNGWVIYAGTGLTIQGGEVVLDYSQEHSATTDCGTPDGIGQVDIYVPNTDNWAIGVMFRVESQFNIADCWAVQASRTGGGSEVLDLYDFVGGSPTLIDTQALTGVGGVTSTFSFTMNGNDVSSTVNGVTVSGNSSHHASAFRHGIRTYAIIPYSNGAEFDNWSFNDDPSAPAAGTPTARRMRGMPFVGSAANRRGSGRMWGKSKEGLYVPRRFAA